MKKIYTLDRAEIMRFVRFCAVGLTNTAVDYLSFVLLCRVLGVNIYISQAAAFMIATLNSYLLNRKFTFRSREKLFGKRLLGFYVLNIFTMSISILALYIFCDILGINELIAKIPVMPITFLINYLGNRLIIFRRDVKNETKPCSDTLENEDPENM